VAEKVSLPYAVPPLAQRVSVEAAPNSPLSPEHLWQITEARKSSRKIRRAVSVARFDGWSLALAAGLTFVLSIGDRSGMAIGILLAAIAGVELYNANRLRALNPQAARVLGFNQIALALLLIVYSICKIYAAMSGKGEVDQIGQADPMAAQMLKDTGITQMVTTMELAIYSGLIAYAIFAPGGMALYYFTRVKHVRKHLSQTAPWIIAMQKADISI
jgi:hypothetical protein